MIRLTGGFDMDKLNDRQLLIIKLLEKQVPLSPGKIHNKIGVGKVSRPTINRDLAYLLSLNLILKLGQGRNVTYKINQNYLIRSFDIDEYFKEDYRIDIKKDFNMDIFNNLNNILNEEEIFKIKELNNLYKEKILGQTTTGIKKELERLTIEFSWKSSSIEGNTYTLLDTERLLKDNVKAEGHSDLEAQMIINHKNALSYIVEEPNYFKELNVLKICEIHSLLSYDLGIKQGIRKSMVGITGTNFRPLDNEFSINEALEKLINALYKIDNAVEKALISVAMLSYIQPFEDGNKRTARMIANAILLAHGYIPVSFVGVNNLEYKKAVILFYEQNSIVYLKELFLEQYELSTNKYF